MLAVPVMLRLALLLVVSSVYIHAQGIITTIAGGGQFQVTGIGGPANNVPLGTIKGVATDSQGNVYAVDVTNFIVVKIATDGILTIVAGNGTSNFVTNGDGGLAVNASFQRPGAIAVDGFGNIFLTDATRIRKVTPQGIITTVAGSGKLPYLGYTGEGGPATEAALSGPNAITVDNKGNLYMSDAGRILKVNAQGIISTVSSGGSPDLAVGPNGDLYITGQNQILRIGGDGAATVVAGINGFGGFAGDGGPATAAQFDELSGIAFDSAGSLYISDLQNKRIRKVTRDGIIHTIAGTGAANFTGDLGAATLATLNQPTGIAVDLAGNVYFGDSVNSRVRRIDASGIISTYAGNGNWGFAGDGGQARDAVLRNPAQLLLDSSGNIYFSDQGNNRVRKIASDGTITTFAGGGAGGFAGDGGPGPQALLNKPSGLAFDSAGNLYIADTANSRIRKVDSGGVISTFAGNGDFNDTGDGGPAINAGLGLVTDVACDRSGNVYMAVANTVRKVSPSGIISTVATFTSPYTVAFVSVDSQGNLYASVIPPIFSGGGPAGRAPIPFPPDAGLVRILSDGTTSVVGTFIGKAVFDSRGNLYVRSGLQIFLVGPEGTATVVANAGTEGFVVDPAGNLFLVDGNLIRRIFLNPASGLFQPSLQRTLQPGYYIAAVTLGQGEHPGYWGMQVSGSSGVLDGGYNFGGAIQQSNRPPGYGGFYVPSAESVHFHVDAQAADGSSNPAMALRVQLLDASKNPLIDQNFAGTAVDFTQALSPGYYTLTVNGGANSPLENFQVSMVAPGFAGAANFGGFAAPGSVGFGSFYLAAPQQVDIQVYGQPSLGVDAAGGLRLTLYDANRNVIATMP